MLSPYKLLEYEIVQGTTFELDIQLANEQGQPVDASAWVIHSCVLRSNSTNGVEQFVESRTIDINQFHVITLTLTAAQTTTMPSGKYTGWVYVTDQAGTTKCPYKLQLIITRGC